MAVQSVALLDSLLPHHATLSSVAALSASQWRRSKTSSGPRLRTSSPHSSRKSRISTSYPSTVSVLLAWHSHNSVANRLALKLILDEDLWILGLTILGSVLLFGSGRGQLAYIDALVFAAGANTQAGLNTVDINLLNTFQQLVLFFCSMLANPITINSFVVFLRLYWFEKRFQNVVRESRLRRGTLSKTKSKAKTDAALAERGVNGRNIMVMHDGTKSRITNDGILLDSVFHGERARQNGALSDSPLDEEIDPKSNPVGHHESRRPEIKFAETVKRSDGLGDDTIRLPPRSMEEDHIAILERQRNPSDEVLRIPGPRDADRGALPRRIGTSDADDRDPSSPLRKVHTADSTRNASQLATGGERSNTITIKEPPKPSGTDELVDDARALANALSPLRLRIPRMFSRKDRKLHHEDNAVHMAGVSRPNRRHTF